MHWHLIVIKGLEQLSVGKLYYFKVHCVAFNISISEIPNQVKTAYDSENTVIENLLGMLGGQVSKQENTVLLVHFIQQSNSIHPYLLYFLKKKIKIYSVCGIMCPHLSWKQ